VFVVLDDGVQGGRIDESPFNEQRFQSLDAQGHFGGRITAVLMLVIVRHARSVYDRGHRRKRVSGRFRAALDQP